MKLENDIEKIEHKRTNNCEDFSCSGNDNFAFVPIENIRIIERVIGNLEEIKQRLSKVMIHHST